MYENDTSKEKHPIRFACALFAALVINAGIGKLMLNSGVDDRLQREAMPTQIVSNLGAEQVASVQACRNTV